MDKEKFRKLLVQWASEDVYINQLTWEEGDALAEYLAKWYAAQCTSNIQRTASKANRQPAPCGRRYQVKIIENENETIIYPMLAENDIEQEEDFCIVVGNSMTLIDSRIIDDDDIQKIIEGLELALEVVSAG